MCGICGVNGFFRDNGKIFKHLLRENVARGRDATGVIWKNVGSKEFKSLKTGTESPDFLKNSMKIPDYCKTTILLGHTRNSTSGSPKDMAENHPHVYGDWMVMHNGVIDGVDELYAECGVEKKVFCDSAVIPVAFETYGFVAGLEKLGGWFSIIAVNVKEPDKIYIAKNYSEYASVCIGRIDETSVIFSSREDDVKKFTNSTFMLSPNSWKVYENGVQIDRGTFIPKPARTIENYLTAGDDIEDIRSWRNWVPFKHNKIDEAMVTYGD